MHGPPKQRGASIPAADVGSSAHTRGLMSRRSIVVFVVACALSGAPAGAEVRPIAREGAAHAVPLFGTIVHAWDAPDNDPFAPGHRGIDVAAPTGTTVRASADGIVSFAGVVAGNRSVSVDHPADLRTTYSFLGTSAVKKGDVRAPRRHRRNGRHSGPRRAVCRRMSTSRCGVRARISTPCRSISGRARPTYWRSSPRARVSATPRGRVTPSPLRCSRRLRLVVAARIFDLRRGGRFRVAMLPNGSLVASGRPSPSRPDRPPLRFEAVCSSGESESLEALLSPELHASSSGHASLISLVLSLVCLAPSAVAGGRGRRTGLETKTRPWREGSRRRRRAPHESTRF